jgi:RNA polymerase sigma-70 factor (ECF subfamily)
MDAFPLTRGETLDQHLAGDEDLALRAKADPAAFGELYVRHRQAVFSYLRARSGDDDEALELTAVTFERALIGIGRYASRGAGPRAWLFRIARNAAIDQARRRRPLTRAPISLSHPSAEPSPEEAAVSSDENRRIRELVARLPDLQRDAIAMRFGAGMTSREIGIALGKSEEATQKLLARAVTRLRETYRDHE